MSFLIFMCCIVWALFFGMVLNQLRMKISEKAISTNKKYEYAEVCFKNIDAPKEVMEELSRLADLNGVVRVYDYYLFCGVQSSAEDAKYGWKSVTDFSIDRFEDRYVLCTPNPKLLEK